MNTITIPKNLIQNDDLVILPRKEYEMMKTQMIPVFYLRGKNAKLLDKRVNEALTEYSKGETELSQSFFKKYGN